MVFRKVVLKDFGGTIIVLEKNGFVVSDTKGLINAILHGESETIHFRDRNYNTVFRKGDRVVFRVENVLKKGSDKPTVFFGVVNVLTENGFYYGETCDDGLWADIKGFLTASESLDDNPYEIGDVVRIEVKK